MKPNSSRAKYLGILVAVLVATGLAIYWLRPHDESGDSGAAVPDPPAAGLTIQPREAPVADPDPEPAGERPENATGKPDAAEDPFDESARWAAALSDRGSLFLRNSFKFSPIVARALEIDYEQSKALEKRMEGLAKDIAEELASHARLVKSENGEVYFAIDKIDGASALRESFKSEIAPVIGRQKAAMITALAERSAMFAGFGSARLQVYQAEFPEPDTGQMLPSIVVEFFDDSHEQGVAKYMIPDREGRVAPLYDLLLKRFESELRR